MKKKKSVKNKKVENEEFQWNFGSRLAFAGLILFFINLLSKLFFNSRFFNDLLFLISLLIIFIGLIIYFLILRNPFRKSWNFIKSSKNFIFVAIGIFLVFCFVGYFAPLPEEFSEMILNYIKEILEQTKNLSTFGMVKFLFWNNLRSSFYAVLFGMFFGIFPLISAIANGFLVGFVSAISVHTDGFLSLWRLLPHGIFELPAVFISMGLGLKLGSFVFKEKPIEKLKVYFRECFRVFVFIVIPLLLIAGIIEGILIVGF